MNTPEIEELKSLVEQKYGKLLWKVPVGISLSWAGRETSSTLLFISAPCPISEKLSGKLKRVMLHSLKA